MDRGYVHIYTGEGKGKTTAAFGLALRAAGAGLRTVVIQFMKGKRSSELDAAGMLGGLISVEHYGCEGLCRPGDPLDEHIRHAAKALQRSRDVVADGKFRVVILDEVITAASLGVISFEDIKELIHMKPPEKELVLTGRGADDEIISLADLVTEMKMIKHYFGMGVNARRGIED
ncbi:MAG: cob(I)yrinic acid a,c-diamide adenosyltransferase [Spirochaetes bacterium]|jgi:cob(I)alamin adenosyltransferase|nr:cob(I)yrinic acid a,c-diamide adenosyltransferase [Spirochaetota bacterium]